MAIHERHFDETNGREPTWPHEHDGLFTDGCPACDATTAVLAAEVEIRLAVRDRWIAGNSFSDVADETRVRTGSTDARELVVRAVLAEDLWWSEHAKSDAWSRELSVLAATSGLEAVPVGWLPLWAAERESTEAAGRILSAVLDELRDARRSNRE